MRVWIIPVAAAVAMAGLSGAARADRCAWLDDPAVAERAARELAARPFLVELCEPCGDVAPGAPEAVETVAVRPVDGSFHQVFVNGRGIDLAHAYVPTGPRGYHNLAALAGCHAPEVSPRLRVEENAGDGILITAEPAAGVARSSPPAARGAGGELEPPRSRAGSRPDVVVVQVPPPSIPTAWIALLAAAGAALTSSLAWAAWVLVARRRRRRQAMLPRASELRVDR